MKNNRLIAIAAICVGFAFGAPQALAGIAYTGTPVIDMTDDSSTPRTWPGDDLTLGYDFNVAAGKELKVTGLGIFDFGSDGLSAAHDVAVWTEAGALLASATVPSGAGMTLASGNSAGQWVYVNIAALTLGPGDYTIGAFYGANNIDKVMTNQTAVNNIAGVTYTQGQYIYDSTFQKPFKNYAVNEAQYFGPVMVVPEPATLALFGLGLLGLGSAKRKQAS